jgi:hypothetical protein
MPNWCHNKLEVYSENIQSLQNFINLVKGSDSDLSLRNLLPGPYELIRNNTIDFKSDPKLLEEYIFGDSSKWYRENWGTKWDVEAKAHRMSDNKILYTFASAWSPPLEWIKYAATQFPDLEFTLYYDSSESGYEGLFIAQGDISIDAYQQVPGFFGSNF